MVTCRPDRAQVKHMSVSGSSVWPAGQAQFLEPTQGCWPGVWMRLSVWGTGLSTLPSGT